MSTPNPSRANRAELKLISILLSFEGIAPNEKVSKRSMDITNTVYYFSDRDMMRTAEKDGFRKLIKVLDCR